MRGKFSSVNEKPSISDDDATGAVVGAVTDVAVGAVAGVVAGVVAGAVADVVAGAEGGVAVGGCGAKFVCVDSGEGDCSGVFSHPAQTVRLTVMHSIMSKCFFIPVFHSHESGSYSSGFRHSGFFKRFKYKFHVIGLIRKFIGFIRPGGFYLVFLFAV